MKAKAPRKRAPQPLPLAPRKRSARIVRVCPPSEAARAAWDAEAARREMSLSGWLTALAEKETRRAP